jgi:hypothetical protein
MKTIAWTTILRCAAAAALALAVSACAARQDKQQIDAELGCHFDSIKVCQQALTQPVNTAGGITTSNQSYIAQNSPATTWLMAPVKAPGGSEVDVQCQVNYTKKQVIYAYPTPSGKVSDSDRQWLIQTGMCVPFGSTAAPAVAPGVKPPEIKPMG